MKTTDFLQGGHENVARLLLVIDSHLSRALSGEEPDVPLMQKMVDYVIDYVEREHNPVEELVFARLERRERWLYALFEAHARDLRELRLVMARASGVLAAACIDPEYDREKVARGVRAFVDALRRRVLAEDAEFLPAAMQALDEEDWRSIEAAVHARDERFEADFRELATVAGCDCEYA